MTTFLSVQFNKPELEWLQVNLQAFNEEKWTSMGDSAHPIGGGQEHGWFQDFLLKVRTCLMNPAQHVNFTDKAQLDFIKKFLTDYKQNAGEYIFQGPYGTNQMEGAQFPAITGSVNANIQGVGFPDQFQQTGANIFNGILQKLGDVIYPPISGTYASRGGAFPHQ
jgi:hypothetical protein